MEVLQSSPLNAQPERPDQLTSSFITPSNGIFARNHGDIPNIDGAAYSLHIVVCPSICAQLEQLCGLKLEPIDMKLSLEELKNVSNQAQMPTALECAGNRRAEMNEERKTEGLAWGPAVIANIEWEGPLLQDLLAQSHFPINDRLALSKLEQFHIHFKSFQQTQQDTFYASSIPLSRLADIPIILAHSHNDTPLTREHGFPLRVVLPGYIGARSVKWLNEISIEDHETRNFYQQQDYKRIELQSTSEIDKLSGEGKDERLRAQRMENLPPLTEKDPSCAITQPQSGEIVRLVSSADGKRRSVEVKGYALGARGSPVKRVQVLLVPQPPNQSTSLDDIRSLAESAPSSSWTNAQRLEREDGVYLSGQKAPNETTRRRKGNRPAMAEGKSWAWCLWEASIEGSSSEGEFGEVKFALVARVETEDGTSQDPKSEWNVRGVDNRSWFVVRDLRVTTSSANDAETVRAGVGSERHHR